MSSTHFCPPPATRCQSATVLVVEDDLDLQELTQRMLTQSGFKVLLSSDGCSALQRLRFGPDLIILDLGLPDISGLEVLRRVREVTTLPILIVSARGASRDRVEGLKLGADDYLSKPFFADELLARVAALLRRARLPAHPQGTERLQIDPEGSRVYLGGQSVELTATEYELLKTLYRARGKNFTRQELLERVWGTDCAGGTRKVDLCVSRLRAKLTSGQRPDPIRSIWGIGYRYEE